MAPEDAWRDPDEPGEDFAAARRARLRPALAAAFAAHGPRLVERALAPALAGEPPLLGRDRAAAVLALHALAPGDVAAAARAVCAATRPDLADAVALLLSEVPGDYDLLYLCVPPRYRVDEKGEGRVVRASCPSLSAYVASKAACGKLLELVRAGLDRPLSEAAVANADLVTYAARAPPVVSLGMASSVAGTPEFCPVPAED